MSFLHRVTGVGLKDRGRSSDILRELRRAAARRRSVNGAGRDRSAGRTWRHTALCITARLERLLVSIYSKYDLIKVCHKESWTSDVCFYYFLRGDAAGVLVRKAVTLSVGEAANFPGRAPNQGGYFTGIEFQRLRPDRALLVSSVSAMFQLHNAGRTKVPTAGMISTRRTPQQPEMN
ncbi:uncharacterized protein LOC144462814 [Epinephelus lanceolatus]